MTRDAKSSAPVVLTIAGFDPSGGAGIIADIRTIEMFGCAGVATITSVTFQNAENFLGAVHQTAESVRRQIESIVAEAEIAAVKIGMLPTVEVVREVARLIRELKLPPAVIDPVMQSTTGGTLMADDAIEVFVTELLPLARVVTPNIPEAEKLSGMNIGNEEGMRQAAARIRKLGARAVMIKGGHLKQRSEVRGQKSEKASTARHAIDVLDDGGRVTVFRGGWIDSPPVRGTGCMLSSAIAACLGLGMDLQTSVSTAKRFIADAIRFAPIFGSEPVTLELEMIGPEE
jgi:hydroxymethylpyrimidine kinase/phosphomethylpyrimidine kinase